jgi:hypothetical protein
VAIEKRFRIHVIREEEATGFGLVRYEPSTIPKIIQIASIYLPEPISRRKSLARAVEECEQMAGECDLIVIKSSDRYIKHFVDSTRIKINNHAKQRIADAVQLAEDALRRKTTIYERLIG